MKKLLVASLAVAASASSALAETTPLVDYTTVGTTITGQLGPVAVAGVAVGGVILAARMGWKFFKGFTK